MQIDPYYYILDTIGFPDNLHPIEMPDNFDAYLLCDGKDRRNILIYADRREFGLSDSRSDKDVVRLFLQLTRKLASCDKANDLFDLYDTEELHEACSVNAQGIEIKVYRIRKANLRV